MKQVFVTTLKRKFCIICLLNFHDQLGSVHFEKMITSRSPSISLHSKIALEIPQRVYYTAQSTLVRTKEHYTSANSYRIINDRVKNN